MTNISVGKAREGFSELYSRAAFGKERIVIEKHGRGRVAMIPIEDLQKLQQYEEQAILARARDALAEAQEKGSISLEEFRQKYHR